MVLCATSNECVIQKECNGKKKACSYFQLGYSNIINCSARCVSLVYILFLDDFYPAFCCIYNVCLLNSCK